MTVEPAQIRLRVGGTEIDKWESYAIDSDILTPADAFSFQAPNHRGRYTDAINLHDAVTLSVNGVLQFSGYVDEVQYSGDSRGASVTVTGRDAFGQLVDVSATPKTYRGLSLLQLATTLSSDWIRTWETQNEANRARLLRLRDNRSLAQHAAALLAPHSDANYGDAALANVATTQAANLSTIAQNPLSRVKVEPGESIYEVIDREAQKLGLMVWQAADGVGVIAKPSYSQLELYALANKRQDAAKNNVLRATVTHNGQERFGVYRMLSYSGNTKSLSAKSSRHQITRTDSTVPAARVLISQQDARNSSELRRVTDRDLQRRAFESERLQYTVRGHFNEGAGWQIDTLCRVADDIHGVSGTYYVAARRFEGDAQGQRTVVTLHPAGVYLP